MRGEDVLAHELGDLLRGELLRESLEVEELQLAGLSELELLCGGER